MLVFDGASQWADAELQFDLSGFLESDRHGHDIAGDEGGVNVGERQVIDTFLQVKALADRDGKRVQLHHAGDVSLLDRRMQAASVNAAEVPKHEELAYTPGFLQ